jgi:SAM-dependent methyltransferase
MANLPNLYNMRAHEQWEIIQRHVDFSGKSVIDLGCGYGDIVARAIRAGAAAVGMEKDRHIVRVAQGRFHDVGLSTGAIIHGDITTLLDTPSDIAICFSVLPYLEAPWAMLSWIARNSNIALIEAQYVGDGPGSGWSIKDDDDMADLLGEYWESVESIGWTHVKDRDVNRTIWKCVV